MTGRPPAIPATLPPQSAQVTVAFDLDALAVSGLTFRRSDLIGEGPFFMYYRKAVVGGGAAEVDTRSACARTRGLSDRGILRTQCHARMSTGRGGHWQCNLKQIRSRNIVLP